MRHRESGLLLQAIAECAVEADVGKPNRSKSCRQARQTRASCERGTDNNEWADVTVREARTG
jgi:hypothetical protein